MSLQLIILKQIAAAAPGAHVNCLEPGGCDTGLPHVQASSAAVASTLQVVFGILGALALIVIVLAGLQFITSNGDPQGTARARNAIIYAAVGLAVCVSAELFVTFVLNNV